MKPDGYYSSGEFAKLAQVTLRTIRYYDKLDILKPSLVSESGSRFYTDKDLARLQQILLLKYLGFSLEEIREMTVKDADYHLIQNSLRIQQKLVEDRMEQMQLVLHAIEETSAEIGREHSIDWTRMLNLIHLTGMEKSLKNQYQDASNISARINLHSLYSQNQHGWFPWIFEQCRLTPGLRVLELGCGDGSLWMQNRGRIPEGLSVTLSDISDGMLRDARRNLNRSGLQPVPDPHGTAQNHFPAQGADTNRAKPRFSFSVFDCEHIPFPDQSFDLVIANHVLFYCKDPAAACREAARVLAPGGRFVCSTYGSLHMKEISRLVQDFDPRIVLAAKNLYDRFGRENGAGILGPYFFQVTWIPYEDRLMIPEPDALISYILSCHGNQNQYIVDRYREFRAFVKKKTDRGLQVTKDAGIFLCEKKEKTP